MHHGHYPKARRNTLQNGIPNHLLNRRRMFSQISPVVRQFCLEKGLPYVHFESVWDNTKACAKHLFQMGHEEVGFNRRLK